MMFYIYGSYFTAFNFTTQFSPCTEIAGVKMQKKQKQPLLEMARGRCVCVGNIWTAN